MRERRRVGPEYDGPTADEYIDDLPIKDGGPSVRDSMRSGKRRDASSADAGVNVHPDPPKPVATVAGGVVVSLCAVALVVIGWTIGTVQFALARDEDRDTQVATTPTTQPPAPVVTVTVESLPASCRKALASMDKYLDAAAAVGNAHSHQLDIISESYVAILEKDWRGLNAMQERQRDLGRTLGPASSKVLPVLVEVRKEIDQCRSDAR
jgi:hypothetical protein